jgi:hypothetical protein
MKLEQTKIIKLIALVLVFIVVGLAAFFFGDRHGLESMTIKRVTPDQAATAMKGDHFYSDYGASTLLIKGTVSSVYKTSDDLVVTFQTNSSFKTICDFGNSSAAIQPRDTITALSEGGSAKRQQSAVLLTNCVIP